MFLEVKNLLVYRIMVNAHILGSDPQGHNAKVTDLWPSTMVRQWPFREYFGQYFHCSFVICLRVEYLRLFCSCYNLLIFSILHSFFYLIPKCITGKYIILITIIYLDFVQFGNVFNPSLSKRILPTLTPGYPFFNLGAPKTSKNLTSRHL